jgi:hypothetical protein
MLSFSDSKRYRQGSKSVAHAKNSKDQFSHSSCLRRHASTVNLTLRLQVLATDAAGNVQTAPTSRFWTVDLTPPYVTITSPPPVRTSNQTVQLFFWAGAYGSHAIPCDRCEYACSLDGGFVTDCESGVSFGGLTEGWHYATVIVKHRDGGLSSSVSCDWTVDLTAPVAKIKYPPPDPTSATNAFFR